MTSRLGFVRVLLALSAGISLSGASIGTVGINPATTPVGVGAAVTIAARIDDPAVIAASVNLQQLDPQNRVIAVVGTLTDDGTRGDLTAGDKNFTLRFNVYQENPGPLIYRVTAGFAGTLVRVNSTPVTFTVTGDVPTGVVIQQPANLVFLNTSPATVSGTTGDPAATVRVNGIAASKNGTAFQTTVPLQEGTNTITAVASNSNGTDSTASIQVTLDTTPPHVTIDSPGEGFKTTESSITVTGIVNDIVVGTVNSLQAQVRVNGLAAIVANRTYIASNIPLQLGANIIQVIARDQTGNSVTTSVHVTRDTITQPFIKLISGNNQSGTVGTQLPSPLVVQLLNGAAPVPNTPVIFKITENDGFLKPGPSNSQLIVVNTDSQGQAQALYTLGNRSGAGNNTVESYSTGFQGTALFVASGTPKPAAKINVDSGNNQFGPVSQALVLPFVAVVTDVGHNRLAGVQVTFKVTQGGGSFNGSTTLNGTTDGDGRVLATLKLGSQPGQDNNVVEANFTNSPGLPAVFTASAKIPGDPAQTSISGVVLDNSNQPIPGVTMRVFQAYQGDKNNTHQEVATPVQTDANGLFKILPAPVGFYKLMADGQTATVQGKQFPTLEYDIVTVAGQDNTVGMPIYLPVLDPSSKICVDETHGGTLRIASAPGFSLTILPGAATFPGGSKTGCVSVSAVNPDKSPMVPGFGQQPRYLVTIQPVGTTFNPPAAITIPNMDGLPPNAKTEMYSYDHDLAAFVAIGSATVSADGSIIASDPGVGVIKAGWHCGGNPNTSGSAGTCPACQTCQGSNCVPIQLPPSRVTSQYDVSFPPRLLDKVNSVFNYIPGLGGSHFDTVRIGGITRISACCSEATDLQPDGLTEQAGRFQMEVNLQEGIRLFGTPRFTEAFGIGGVGEVELSFELSVTTLRGRFQFNVDIGSRDSVCKVEDSCIFGEVNAVQQVDLLRGTAEAKACISLFGDDPDCLGAEMVVVPGRVTFGWGVTYNKPDCNAGIGGRAYLGAITARVEASVSVGGSKYRVAKQVNLFSGVDGI